jgi:soluble lytic murein transglycosylase-like protein
MKYVRLSSLWGIAVFTFVSVISPLGLFAETRAGDAMIYPMFRFFRGGPLARVTERTLERIFRDQFRISRAEGFPVASDGGKLERRLARHFLALCRKYELDPAFVLSVIQVESSFRTDVVSSAGAIGLMQLMPDTARVVARRNRIPAVITKKTLKDPFLNVTLGVIYLSELRKRYAGLSPYFHLAAYNMGPHRLDQLRAKPGFKPSQTLKYYQDVMRGVNAWRYYGPKQEMKEAAIQARRTKVKRRTHSALS